MDRNSLNAYFYLYIHILYQSKIFNMKRIVCFFTVLVALTGLSWAQTLRPVSVAQDQANAFGQLDRTTGRLNSTRTTACAADTLIYASYKNLSNLISGVFYRDSGNFVSIAGQWYPAEQNISVSGVEFLADVPTETNYTVDVEVSIWNVGNDSLPIGSPLATETVTVDSGFVFRYATFSPAVEISAGNGYAVTLYNPDQDTAVLFRSNRIADTEGQGELNGMVGALFGTSSPTFFKSTALPLGPGSSYDVDMFIFPIVNYSINADFDAPSDPTDCTPQNTEVDFTNTTSPVAKSRYYNGVKTFKTFRDPSIIDGTFTWRFTATDSLISTDDVVSYTFTNVALAYDVELEVGMSGLSSTGCLDDTTQSLPSGVGAAADFDTDAGTSLTVNFTDVSVASDSVVYDFGDGSISNEENPTHTYSDFGTYSVTQIAYNNCGNDTLTVSITITCNAATADFSFTQTDGFTVAFTDNSQNADSVVITFGDDEEATLTGPTISHTYAAEGTYEVCLTAFNECGPTELCQDVTVILSGLAHLYTGTLSVFPNPSEGSFTVEVFEQGELSMRVFNLMGQEILHQSARGRAVLDLSGEQSGVYLLQGTVDGQRFTKRLIVK